jgi:hypothetical protein
LTYDVPVAIRKIDSVGGRRVELSRLKGCAEIHECISSDVVNKNIELCGSVEETEITRFILLDSIFL